jgi:hypothetical protein
MRMLSSASEPFSPSLTALPSAVRRSRRELAPVLTLSSVQAPLVARDYGAKLLPTYYLRHEQCASSEPVDLVLIDVARMNGGVS